MLRRFRLDRLAALFLASCVLVPSMQSQKKKEYLPAGPGQKPFDVTRHSVPVADLIGGGPPKDGIPSLDRPKFASAVAADKFVGPEDRVLGVAYNGVAKAYPVKILNWHEIVNDDFAGKPVAVTW